MSFECPQKQRVRIDLRTCQLLGRKRPAFPFVFLEIARKFWKFCQNELQ